MKSLRFTLVADGPTDAVLIHPLRWLLVANGVRLPIEPQWPDLRALPSPPAGLESRIRAALDLAPCELLFVHRDAEREPREKRVDEIREAVQRMAAELFQRRPYVCVVPVRMTEAWFLFDEAAIRRAADNPLGRIHLTLPPLGRMEEVPKPKQMLHDLLLAASELPLRRQKRFPVVERSHRLAELIQDFSPLRRLAAFNALENDLRAVIQDARWAG
ncbi:MAG: DUF4276 family protein [Verrucomicrobia bacterium]|nr:DUF4276 family protein [Verrucomicrobiota bacterium]